MTRGSLVTPTCFPPFLSVSNISAPTSSNKNFGNTERPTLKLDAFIPKKHVLLEDEARCNDKMVVQVVTIFAVAAASMAEQWSSHHCLVDCAKDSRWVLPAR
ncbi:hypothetical protein DEO72_LG11g163 [Vigna unguiculata]|uniref:Uncharacterized protein n=1 Tax=Vigna unguiculata TaxID=3917 RepID=A0A4D6NHF1_VIGUN|nr:hypothetical protein DEO72_LG11g163 [Vigna unguiculata]